MVKKILLELIEDDQQRAPQRLPCHFEKFIQRQRRVDRHRLLQHTLDRRAALGFERIDKIRSSPISNDRDRGAWPGPEARHDTREQHRALADAARAVENRQPRGAEIGGDDPLVALAAEEIVDISFGVWL